MAKKFFLAMALALSALAMHGQSAGSNGGTYFTKPAAEVSAPDSDGFLRRWTILEPIDKPNRSNTVFTDSYLREEFGKEYFPGQMTMMPKDGQKVKVGKDKLAWHELESTGYNVQLYRFATTHEKQKYGVLFWVVTTIDVPEDMENVRLSVGSNSASMWWIDGEEALILSGDRRMVMDDGMSERLNLKKGEHVLRGAIINGPGMSNYCVRFLDENLQPVTNIKVK